MIDDQLRKAIEDAIKKGTNQRTIALGAGVDVGIVSRFRSGERSPSLENAAKLAAYLGLSLKR